jgi:MFS-type transporter involved in bile tolerance (Atg22 family)
MNMLILMDTPEVSSRYMGAAGGMFFAVAEIGGFAGPLLMGALVDLTGGFNTGIISFAGLCLLLAGLTFLLRLPQKSGLATQ